MKFLFLGNYSNAGLAGFLKNPEDDRRAAISGMVEKSGGKFISLQISFACPFQSSLPKRKLTNARQTH